MSRDAGAEQRAFLDGVIGKEVLLCYVCSEYHKDPRVLPCQHTFCRGCLQRYHDERQAASSPQPITAIPCPKCQSATQVPHIGVTGFPLDTKLRQLKEVYLNALRKGRDSDHSASSQHTDTKPDGERMPYSATQDKENIGNGRFAFRRRESPRSTQPDSDRPSSWYGQTTTDSSSSRTRPSPRGSWYGAGKKEEPAATPPGADPSKNPFDRSARFAPRRRRKMERTFDTFADEPGAGSGFRSRDRLEEIINNVREEGIGTPAPSAPPSGSYRDRFFGSAESMNGGSPASHTTDSATDSPLLGSAYRKRAKSPARSHSFNMQRPKAYESAEKSSTKPERSGSFQFNTPAAGGDDNPGSPYSFSQFSGAPRTTPTTPQEFTPTAPPRARFGGGEARDPPESTSTPTGTGTPVPPPRSRPGPRSPGGMKAPAAKPSPEPPKFKPKPPPVRTPTSPFSTQGPSYETQAAAASSTPRPTPGMRRSESEPPLASVFDGGMGGMGSTHTPSRSQAPPMSPVREPDSPQTKAEGAKQKLADEIPPPPDEKMDPETRVLYERMRDYYKKRAEEGPKDIPDIESLMKESDSEDDEPESEDIDAKTGPARPEADSHDGASGTGPQVNDTETGPTCNGRQSPVLNGQLNGAKDEEPAVHNKNTEEPQPQLSSDTFSNFNIGPGSEDKAEEAFAEVGEMQFENQTIRDMKAESGSDYDNASDYDNLETAGMEDILRIVEDGDDPEVPVLSPGFRTKSTSSETNSTGFKSKTPSFTEAEARSPGLKARTPSVDVPTDDSPFVEMQEHTEPEQTESDGPEPQFNPTLLWTEEKNEYEMPTAIAFTPNANLVVAEYSTGCILYYDEIGTIKHKVDNIKPFGLAVNKANHVIVGDRKLKTIRVFDEFGYDVNQWEDDSFKWLCGIGTLADGSYITFDREFCKIRVSSPNGEMLREFGTYGRGDTQFTQVDFLTVDSNDRIIVCDSGNHCVKIFTADGQFVDKFGTRGDGNGQMEWPKGICVDAQDNIILTDSKNRRVSMFSPEGHFIQHLVSDLPNVYNVAYTSPGILGVSSYSLSGKSQVSVYTL